MKIKQAYESIMKNISSYINELKTQKNYKYDIQLIEILGVTKGYLSNLLKGKEKISMEKCLILAEELKVNPEILIITMIYEKEENKDTKKKLKAIIKRLESTNSI